MPAAESFIEAPAGAATEAQLGMEQPSTSTAKASLPPELKASEMTPKTAAAPPKPGSAKASIFAELRKKYGSAEEQAAAATETETEGAEETETASTEPDKTKQPEAAKADPKDAKTEPAKPQDKKVNPWKLLEEKNKKIQEMEQKLATGAKTDAPPEVVKQYETRVQELQKKYEELAQEMKFVDYRKTPEFQEKYQKPYEAAWGRAMAELSEITVPEGDTERPINATDILELVNLPLKEAHALAQEKFGDFAADVMQHRKEISRLFNEQSAAVENMKKDGEAFFKQREEARQKAFGEMTQSIKKEWDGANEAALKDEKYGKFFQPIEGDQEGNQRLAKGFELADRAFKENPMAAKTPEERRSIVQRHAAVRMRCAAFGRLVYQVNTSQAKIAELQAKLAEYESSEPSRSGSSASAKGGAKTSAKESIFAELRKRAK